VERSSELGSSLLETAVSLALVAVLAGTALSAVLGARHAAADDPIRDALQSAVRREMPIALDVLKYRGTSIAPASIATTLPMPGESPLPVQLSIGASRIGDGPLRVTITAASSGDDRRSTSLTTLIGDRAPPPGSTQRAPGLVPAPTGAP
jgi:hypothetical protein